VEVGTLFALVEDRQACDVLRSNRGSDLRRRNMGWQQILSVAFEGALLEHECVNLQVLAIAFAFDFQFIDGTPESAETWRS
jgi:hypothetical protein